MAGGRLSLIVKYIFLSRNTDLESLDRPLWKAGEVRCFYVGKTGTVICVTSPRVRIYVTQPFKLFVSNPRQPLELMVVKSVTQQSVWIFSYNYKLRCVSTTENRFLSVVSKKKKINWSQRSEPCVTYEVLTSPYGIFKASCDFI